jgi:hypothetical protein
MSRLIYKYFVISQTAVIYVAIFAFVIFRILHCRPRLGSNPNDFVKVIQNMISILVSKYLYKYVVAYLQEINFLSCCPCEEVYFLMVKPHTYKDDYVAEPCEEVYFLKVCNHILIKIFTY